ncbi:MAG: HAD-IA family hydrolase [Pseudomonadota bacterium]
MMQTSQTTPLIIFDFDGTLVNSLYAITDTLKKTFELEKLNPPNPQAIRQIIGLSIPQAILKLKPNCDAKLLDKLCAHYHRLIVQPNSQFLNDPPLYDGIKELLDYLYKQGYCLAIATGMGRKKLDQELDRLAITLYFTITRCADDGPSKPDPQNLLDIIKFCNALPQNTMMIGDSSFDMEMAIRANIKALGVSWGYHNRQMLYQSGAISVVDQACDIVSFIENRILKND